MFESALLGVLLFFIVGALIGVLSWLFDHGGAVASALIVAPILLWVWWQEWFSNVFVFALMAVVPLGVVTRAQEGLLKLWDYRGASTRDHHRSPTTPEVNPRGRMVDLISTTQNDSGPLKYLARAARHTVSLYLGALEP
jgi:hypothetical protein